MLLAQILLQVKFTHGVHVSGMITENTTFFYRKLPVAPSVRATIEFSVSYNKSLVRNEYPTMAILTTYPKLNIEKKCSFIQFGQLRNEDLLTYLRLRGYRKTSCEMSGADTVNCRGTFTVQDYIPRNFYLTFGFQCDLLRIYSLQGLRYNISFTRPRTNTNGCTDYSMLPYSEACDRFYSETSVPNLFGDEHVDQIVSYFKQSIVAETFLFVEGTCYQHLWEVACYILLPKCDPDTQLVIHPCKEMCWDFIDGCWKKLMDLLARIDSEFRYINRNHLGFMSSAPASQTFDCDYLPSLHDNISCFHKPITCDSPPDVSDGLVILNPIHKDVYHLHDVIQYACIDEAFEMIGNSSITCLYSGQWSNPPSTCRRHNHLHPLVVVLSVLLIPFMALIIGNIMIKVKYKTTHVLTRDREFDSFVCYKFDTDNNYVLNVIMTGLEEICEPPLKLCVYERDFLPGLFIEDNIKGAIAKSNSAIIVMSQAFIDSVWCQKEFAHCYLENMKDPAFKIFMIMMQPVDCLDNLSEPMQNFIDSKIYLSKYDPRLFQKIVSYLHWVKLPKDKKTKEPPNFKAGEALLKQDVEDDLVDNKIEVDFVPSDPFLSVRNYEDHHDDANDAWQTEDDMYDLAANLQENTQNQVEVEVHHNG